MERLCPAAPIIIEPATEIFTRLILFSLLVCMSPWATKIFINLMTQEFYNNNMSYLRGEPFIKDAMYLGKVLHQVWLRGSKEEWAEQTKVGCKKPAGRPRTVQQEEEEEEDDSKSGPEPATRARTQGGICHPNINLKGTLSAWHTSPL